MNKFSIAFYVIDALNKRAVNNVIITHDGMRGGYQYRGDGYYVFKNMLRKDYKFELTAKGYQSRAFFVSLKDDENLSYEVTNCDPNDPEVLIIENPGVILCLLNYSSQRRSLVPQPYAMIKEEGNPLANKRIWVTLESKVTDMRVAKTVNEGNNEVSANGGFFEKYMHQNFVCTSEQNPIYISDYNFEKDCYILKNPVTKKLKIGTLLKPTWELRTDSNGKVFLPVNADFFFDKTMEFSVKYGNISKKIKVDPSNGSVPYEIEF